MIHLSTHKPVTKDIPKQNFKITNTKSKLRLNYKKLRVKQKKGNKNLHLLIHNQAPKSKFN
jgi:hypothetical protein